MKHSIRLFVLAGFLITVAMAMFVSPWASQSSDGMSRVARDQGFASQERDHAFEDSPLADYDVEGVEGDRLSTGVAGAIGVLLTFGLMTGVLGLLRLPSARKERERRS
jgi:hypothetical protein